MEGIADIQGKAPGLHAGPHAAQVEGVQDLVLRDHVGQAGLYNPPGLHPQTQLRTSLPTTNDSDVFSFLAGKQQTRPAGGQAVSAAGAPPLPKG